MGTRAAPVRKSKRSLGDYTRALGSAHKKASVHLETSMPLVAFILAKLNFITARKLPDGWRYAVVAFAIIAGA